MNGDEIYKISTGRRIRRLRQQQGFSLEQLARLINVPILLMKIYEADREPLPYNLAKKAAEVLHTTPGYLLCWEESLSEIYNQMTDEEALFEEPFTDIIDDTESESISLFYEMTYKSPEEKDEIIDTGAFHKHIEGYLIYTLGTMGCSDKVIAKARTILTENVLSAVSAETAREAGEAAPNTSDKPGIETKIYKFPQPKKEP